MIRKLLLPAVCATLLGGCATGYGYSDGGYYYGRPSSSVRYYGGASYGYPSSYGYPYGYGYGDGYYGYRRYGYPYGGYYGGGDPYAYRRHYCGDGHRHDCGRGRDDHGNHGHNGNGHNDGNGHNGKNDRPPWRRWADDRGDMLRRQRPPQPRPAVGMAAPSQPRAVVERPAMPRMAPPSPMERRLQPRMAAPERSRNRQERDLRREHER